MLSRIIKLIIAVSVIYTAVSSYINAGNQDDVASGDISSNVEAVDVVR